MIAQVHTAAVVGIDAVPIVAEVALASALPSFTVVGLPQGAVREGRERVASALRASGFQLPPKRITVNLSPGDLRKEGTGFDLPIALGILAAAGVIPPAALDGVLAVGELGLDGSLKGVRGALPVALHAAEAGRTLLVPAASVPDACRVDDVEIVGGSSLVAVVEHLRGDHILSPTARQGPVESEERVVGPDLADIRGQVAAKRAVTIAAAGGHNLLLIGPPGSGKTMLATALPRLLPPLTDAEAIEVARIRSVAGAAAAGLPVTRPFRAPHPTASYAAMIGGGHPIRPGELSLAHRGVLFLDELPEFPRNVLEALRQPLEDGDVSVSRATGRIRFPARVQLVVAMNPCPCGMSTSRDGLCACSTAAIDRYRRRLSGPLLDRIDLVCTVPALPPGDATRRDPAGERSVAVAARVLAARARQRARAYAGGGVNADMNSADLRRFCRLTSDGRRLLEDAVGRLGLSGRGVDRAVRVARSIADLNEVEDVCVRHVGEALQFRAYSPM